MNKSMTVTQDFPLVNAKYKLNTSEIKFILTAMTQLDSVKDEVLKEYEIKVSELEEKLQAKQNETHLRQFAKKLMSKPLEVPTEDGWIVANWFSDIEYVRGHAKFKVRFSEKLKPYLLQLKERFVSYNLKHVLPMHSNYSIRIYQLLKEYQKLTQRTFEVEELQEILQVPKSYRPYGKFKEKVLRVAERELIEHADIFFEYDEIKEGRRIAKIHFRIKRNTPGQYDAPEKLPNSEEYIGKEIYFNGQDYTIKNVATAEEKGMAHVIIVDDQGTLSAEEINIQKLKLMIDTKSRQGRLF